MIEIQLTAHYRHRNRGIQGAWADWKTADLVVPVILSEREYGAVVGVILEQEEGIYAEEKDIQIIVTKS